jgi:hypothetical protein
VITETYYVAEATAAVAAATARVVNFILIASTGRLDERVCVVE